MRSKSKSGNRDKSILALIRQNYRIAFFGVFLLCLASIFIFPILVLECVTNSTPLYMKDNSGVSGHVSPEHLMTDHAIQHARNAHAQKQNNMVIMSKAKNEEETRNIVAQPIQHAVKEQRLVQEEEKTDRLGFIPKVEELRQDTGFHEKPVARGVAGRPESLTPALDGAKRAQIQCEVNIDSLAYWNDPVGTRDDYFVSPFRVSDPDQKFISFFPDRGGWNNIRMCMEIIFVIAAATGRTLVLPPKSPLYLLHHAKKGEKKHRGFVDFYPINSSAFQRRVKTISMEDFVKREALGDNPRFPIPIDIKEQIVSTSAICDYRADSDISCTALYEWLNSVGNVPNISSSGSCLVFDQKSFHGEEPSEVIKEYAAKQCGKKRSIVYWNDANPEVLPVAAPLIHFNAGHRDKRLLAHFYSMLHFSDPKTGNYFKRFVRDFLHYHDSIFCAAGKIVKAVQAEAASRGFHADQETGSGGYSSLHIRRGDLQYKAVKISAEEWYENTKEVWLPNEILYVATDERNKTFFDDLAEHHDLRFLDDYWDFANLSALDGNYMGMIDTIVASRGRAFAGTWFSTFSGFINRMRGYHGMSMMDSWYSFLDKKDSLHRWEIIDEAKFSFEWPDGWVGIDADEWPTKNKF